MTTKHTVEPEGTEDLESAVEILISWKKDTEEGLFDICYPDEFINLPKPERLEAGKIIIERLEKCKESFSAFGLSELDDVRRFTEELS